MILSLSFPYFRIRLPLVRFSNPELRRPVLGVGLSHTAVVVGLTSFIRSYVLVCLLHLRDFGLGTRGGFDSDPRQSSVVLVYDT